MDAASRKLECGGSCAPRSSAVVSRPSAFGTSPRSRRASWSSWASIRPPRVRDHRSARHHAEPSILSHAMTPERAIRPLTGGAVMTAVGKVGVAAAVALTAIAIARLLGPSGSGAYFIAQSLVLLLTVATTLGIE